MASARSRPVYHSVINGVSITARSNLARTLIALLLTVPVAPISVSTTYAAHFGGGKSVGVRTTKT